MPDFDEPPPPSDDYDFGPGSKWEQVEKIGPVRAESAGPSPQLHDLSSGSSPKEQRKNNDPGDLRGILEKVFGFRSFRPFQQKVCESVAHGKDLLLVMPTGSGKSLCYQLPGIARQGTTLVVSPLIALMEDQVSALKQQGLEAERIHSGRSRLQSRQVCGRYLGGDLDFLFIAPERLAVPGFPEMLAKRRPTLVAIDEAHCISQWGHDFRPDYRLLGDRLPILRPAPVIAMTATATPRVQQDIIQQLRIDGAEMCIHGFRRTNIAIELVELPPSQRSDRVLEILMNKESRPAIVYAPTRQKTEDLARMLGNGLSVEPYHAGMSSELRDKVQNAFISGELDAIVATIAFGMGIDKANVRTVIHTALPGSIEGYYQEIGRAGRDGLPSRAILFHSYGDVHVHRFFHEKNYPQEDTLGQIYSILTGQETPLEKLRREVNMEEEDFNMALEKLWIHGGALVSPNDTVRRGHNRWQAAYRLQSDHRLGQIDEVARFAKSYSCRMLYLVQHFGDHEDHGRPCGLCDVCAPSKSTASGSREPTPQERNIIQAVMSTLQNIESLGTGKLYSDANPESGFARSDFENILKSLAKADLITLSEHSFEKEGRTIHYKRAALTPKGQSLEADNFGDLAIISTGEAIKRKVKTPAVGKPAQKPKVIRRPVSKVEKQLGLYGALRIWRMETAQKRGLPAFRIFGNKVLDNLAADPPQTMDELHQVHGVGPYLVKQYGKEIIRIVKGYSNEKR
jgi:DNA topoisomerase III